MVSNSLSSISRSRCGNSSVRTPSGFSRILSPSTKSFRSGTCASTLLPRTRSAQRPSAANSFASSVPKNRTSVGTPFSTATLATFAAGSIPKHRHVLLDKILQQVAVVAGDFDDKALLVQTEAACHLVAVILAMLQPRIGVGREIGVVAEDILRALVFFQLHQKALLADVDVERIVDLAAIQIGRRWIGLAQWRHTQIDKGSLQSRRRRSGTAVVADRLLHVAVGSIIVAMVSMSCPLGCHNIVRQPPQLQRPDGSNAEKRSKLPGFMKLAECG